MMGPKYLSITALTILLALTPSIPAAACEEEDRPYIGVGLDPTPLPDLLTKHLRLNPDQGIRIRNIDRDSPAGKAGLERDDIIIGFQGRDVTDMQEFVEQVRDAGIGTQVSLEIINLGHRKTINLKLEKFDGEHDWKYPPEPDFVESWHPGRIFRFKPGEEDWEQVPPFSDLPTGLRIQVIYHGDGEGGHFEVRIEGNPNDDDARIIVTHGDTKFNTTVAQIDMLPKKYRSAVQADLKNARRSWKRDKHTWPFSGPAPFDFDADVWHRYFDTDSLRRLPRPPYIQPDYKLKRMEKQLRDLRQRLDELEKRHQELGDRDEPEEQSKNADDQAQLQQYCDI